MNREERIEAYFRETLGANENRIRGLPLDSLDWIDWGLKLESEALGSALPEDFDLFAFRTVGDLLEGVKNLIGGENASE